MMQVIFFVYEPLIVASLLTLAFVLLFRPLAVKASLVDTPNKRKIHFGCVPLTGGVSIVLASVLTSLIFFQTFSVNFIALLFCATSMLVLGTIDDKFSLRAPLKLFFQTVIVVIFITFGNYKVTNLGSPIGFPSPLELGLLSVPFTLLAIVGLTNAINMIDGCDGLASSLVIISLTALSIFGDAGLSDPTRHFLLVVLSSVIVFLPLNFSKSTSLKTFLGDGGSLSLGFIVATSLIEFASSNTLYDPSIVLWFVALPIFDFCAVIARRKLLKTKIMAADNSHIHHSFLSWGFSHFQTTALISVAAVALLLFGVFLTSNYPSFSFWTFLAFFLLYFSIRMSLGRVK